jgi:hypothetical protein
VRGPAAELLLLLTRRAGLGDRAGLEVAGDRRLLAHWLDHSRF